MIKELTCIVCPMGCSLKAEIINDRVVNITGNTCARGENYAVAEFTDPRRTVTTTIKCDNGKVLPVKTDRAVPKDKMFDCIKIINSNVAHLPISVGDVIIKDVFGSNIVATAKAD